MKQSAMIIINPSAGKEKAASYEGVIKEELKDKYANLSVKYTQGAGDATKFAREACQDNFDLVVSLGGDGTVNETVNGLASFETPPMLGIIPLGTVNMLARVLNIPIKPEKAIKLLKNDYYKEIDVGLANGKYFTNVLSVGQAAKAIYDVDIEDKTKLGFLAYVNAVGKEILKDDVFSVRLETDEETWEGEVSVIIIGLLDSLAGLKTILSNGDISDGIMHVIAIKSIHVSDLISMTPSLVFGGIIESENIVYFKTKSLKLDTLDNSQYESNIDGDEGPKLPLEIKVLPKRLKVVSKEE
ncbi:MAG: diacylglycerol kinase family lipid kinase [Clostridiales bacterium]|nr:diacylglycerol kinase family lipid kinase [Clostridiales bacterium]